ncbi:MAG: hypothetical protein PHQ06_05095 [Atribacterota bacterium]|jgi:hypothetical protein|nr:hypothetical protein [Atribacterota bacterium]
MNINKKYIIVFGTLILLLVIITGAVTYYNEKKSEELTQVLNEIYYTAPAFNQNYPISFEEADSFQKFCAVTATRSFMMSTSLLSNEELMEEEILANRCILTQRENTADFENRYTLAFSLLSKVPVLHKGQYIGIAVNYDDLFQKNNLFLDSEEKEFSLCTIIKPTLRQPFRERLLLNNQINSNHSMVFPEGEIYCKKFFKLPTESDDSLITGFVPETDVFQARIYLVPENKNMDELFSQESFLRIEEILQSYALIWSVEKPVI